MGGSLEEEHRQHVQISEKAGLAERKANALHGELEESRALLDSADRGKKQCEMELSEARTAIIPRLCLRRGILSLLATLCMLRLMISSTRLRTLRIRPKRPWLMLPGWLMSSVLSKIMLQTKRRVRGLLSLKSMNSRIVLQRPMS